MALDTSHGQVTLVENSDDRLAVAEEAKRSGEPLRSVGANLTVPVPSSTAIGIAEGHLDGEVYVGSYGQTYPKHLEEIHDTFGGPEGDKKVAATNEEKAAQHEAYSADLERARIKEEEETQKRIKEGYRVDEAIVESNLRRAEEHEAQTRDWKLARNNAEAKLNSASQVQDIVVAHTANLDVIDDAKVSDALKSANPVPKADESAIKQGLKIKDQIISAQRNFNDSASDIEKALSYDHPAKPIMDEAGSAEGVRTIHEDHLAAKRKATGELDGATKEATERKEAYVEGTDTTSGKEAAEDGKPTNTESKNAKSASSAAAKAESNKESRDEKADAANG